MEVSQKTLKRFDGRGNFKKYISNNFLQKKEFCRKKNIKEIFKILQSNYLVFSFLKNIYSQKENISEILR